MSSRTDGEALIAVENLAKSYGKVEALKGMPIAVRRMQRQITSQEGDQ